jgi:uncharacterized membrane protein (DUF2068 family)
MDVMPWGMIYFTALLIGYGVLAVVFAVGLWLFVGLVQEIVKTVYRKNKTK